MHHYFVPASKNGEIMTFKLLIVDDESTMRKGIAEFMNWNTIDCEVAGTASDGLEAIAF